MLLAHPVTETAGGLPVAPAFVAVLACCLLLLVRFGAQRLTPRDAPSQVAPEVEAPSGPVGVIGRTVGVALLFLAVLAGRLGSPDQLDNIATPLVIGFGWPVLLLLSTIGDPWRVLNPFDGGAGVIERVAGGSLMATPPDRVLDRVALAGALGWTWWLGAYQPGLQPRAIGAALGLYAIGTWAGCLLVGRRRWIARAEVFTVVFSMIDAARRRRPLAPEDPVTTIMAVVLGGLVFAELRFSRWFLTDVQRLGLGPFSEPATVLGFIAVVGLALLTVHGCVAWAGRLGSRAEVQSLLPWLIIGAGLSAAVERDRLWTSAQVLLTRLSDPFGTGIDLFGTAGNALRAWPWGDGGRLTLQLAVLLVPIAIGLTHRVRTTDDRRLEPAVVLMLVWTSIATMSVATS